MTAFEDKLRDALTATADLVTPASIRPGQPLENVGAAAVPATRRRPVGPTGERRARHGRLVPVLTMVAVVLLAAGAFSLSRLFPGDGTLDASAGVSARPLSASSAVSPAQYFVTSMMGGSDADANFQELTVRDAVTGAVTAVVPAFEDSGWSAVEATSDPRTFYALSVGGGHDIHNPPRVPATNRMYRLVISTDGKVESLVPIESLGTPEFAGFAVSPDGTRLAVDGGIRGPNGFTPGIAIVNVSDGHTRTFLANRIGGTTDNFTWSADGRYLGYELDQEKDHQPGPGITIMPSDPHDIWILDTSRDGTDLLASSRHVVTLGQSDLGTSMLTFGADGTRLYYVIDQLKDSVLTKRVIEIDASTGRQLRVLLEVRHGYTSAGWSSGSELALDPSGRWLMVSDSGTDYYRIDLGAGQSTHLPTVVHRGSPNGLAW